MCRISHKTILHVFGLCYAYTFFTFFTFFQESNRLAIPVSLPDLTSFHPNASSHKTTTQNNTLPTTLALLYPQGLVGGYRNQFLRFSAFVAHAHLVNATQLLLPTILWGTQYNDTEDPRAFLPLLMQDLFDVQFWNSHHQLPRLVHTIQKPDCWDAHGPVDTSLVSGAILSPIHKRP